MPPDRPDAIARLYAAAARDDRSVLDPLLGARDHDGTDIGDEVCTGFAGTIRFLRFVGDRFVPQITLDQIRACGSGIEVRGRMRMVPTREGLAFEFPFTHQHP